MTDKILRIISPRVELRVPDPPQPFSRELDDWVFHERFESSRFRTSETFGYYQVEMEHPILDTEQAGSLFISGEFYAEALEKSWMYGTGIPLAGRGYEHMLLPAHLPFRWSSNASDVLPESDWALLREGASYTASRRTAPSLPLLTCMKVMDALLETDDITMQIVEYHYGAATTLNQELHFLLLAQGLEMGRALLDGTTKDEQERLLPTAISTRLKNGLNWLFEISNQRRQTRHAINKRGAVELKQRLSDEEEHDFVAGANTVLHFLVCRRLAIPLTLFEDGRTLVVA
jgi:hypothetical protein